MALVELTARRTYTAKTFQQDDGTRVSRCHVGHIHYKRDLDGQFADVDYTWVDSTTHWTMDTASYRMRVAKDFGASSLIQFRNKFEGADQTITFDPRQVVWLENRNFNTATVIGTQQSVQGTISGQTIRYPDAFGSGLHFEITLRRSGFKKDIVVDSFAAFGTPPSSTAHVAVLFRYTGNGLTLADENGNVWDGSSLFEKTGKLTLSDAQGHTSIIPPAILEDASDRTRSIPIAFVQRQSALWQVKILPRNVLDQAIFPIRADMPVSYPSGAGDGFILNNPTSSVWATVHDATAGTTASATGTDMRVAALLNTNFQIALVFIPVDTSTIPDAATISAATLYLMYVSSFSDDDNDGEDFLVVVGPTTQADPATLATGDFDQCGAVANPTEWSERIDLGVISQSTSVYESFDFNATGIAAVSKTGFTLCGLREGHDVLDHAIASSIQVNRWFCASSEDASGTKDPYLDVTWTAPPSSSGQFTLTGVV